MTIALAGYFFSALVAILDKYLLSGPIQAPAKYAFFVSLFSLFTLFFIPFGFEFVTWKVIGLLLISGILLLYGLVAFYYAVKQREVSRIAPLVGTVISLTAFVAVFLPGVFLGESISFIHIFALVSLISGGLLISFDLPLRSQEHIPIVSVILAGMAMGLSLLLLKLGYAQANFVSGLVWSRVGMFLAGCSLLLIPVFRQQIVLGWNYRGMPSRATVYTGGVFVANKILGGIASMLIVYATFLGPVSFVQALSGMQYVFLLALAIPLSVRFPHIFGEKLFFWDWFQKVCAIALIGLGLWLTATSGITVLL